MLLSTSSTYALTTYLGLIFYQLTLLLTKLSILSFYLRMFSSRPVERRLAIATIALVVAYGIPLLTISILQCHHPPASSPSSPSPSPSKCIPFTPLLIASASLHTATDAWLILMIAPAIARLAIPRGQKAALATVLSLSVFVIAASLTRLQLSLHTTTTAAAAGSDDSSATIPAARRVADTLSFFVMTVLECDVALLCACAPTLRPVLARVWPGGMAGDGGGPPGMGRRRRRRRRRLRRRRRGEVESGEEDDEDEDSVNLTVVSYHGYPWAQSASPAGGGGSGGSWGSKNANAAADASPAAAAAAASEMAMSAVPFPPPPRPPPPVAMLRTPTTLSLRSFMSSIAAAPRSRGQTVSGREDREVLLGEGEAERKRRSSVGFEGYYDQYMGYGGEHDDGRRRSRMRDSLGRGIWGDSQESFVLGVNDPASPSRLSPISALSGETVEGGADGRKRSRDGEQTK